MKKEKDTKPEADVSPETVVASSKSDEPKLGRGRRIWRTTLIWMVVIAAALLIGLSAYHFIRYKPVSEALLQTQFELSQANLTNDDLEARIATVDEKIATLESDNQSLQTELSKDKLHLDLLKVLVDVSNARLALFLEDTEGAKVALTGTTQRLESLLPAISEFDASLAISMPQRLSLIVSGLGRDVETAKIDLELLTKDLLEVEKAIFGD
jgi:cell division protein FtsB